MSWSTTARTINARISHGTAHMPGTAIAMRVLVVVFGAGLAVLHPDLWVGALTGLVSAAAGVISLIELHNAALECEQDNDGFGTA